MTTLKTLATAGAVLAAMCGAVPAEAQDRELSPTERTLRWIRQRAGLEALEREPVGQPLTAAHRRFACSFHRVDGGEGGGLDFILTRDGSFDSGGLPHGLMGVSEHGTLGGNQDRVPVLIVRSLFSGGLTFIEAPMGGASLLTINPERPAGAQPGTFTADYVRHVIGLVSVYRGRCTAIG